MSKNAAKLLPYISLQMNSPVSVVCFPWIVLQRAKDSITVRQTEITYAYSRQWQPIYQRVWPIAVSKHHSLLVLLADVIFRCDFTRLDSTNTKIILLQIFRSARPLLLLPRASPAE